MDITDFLKDVNHWGVLVVCVYGIIVCVSNLFKKSTNEKAKIAMTVIAVAFLASIIVWVLFYGSGKSENTASNSEAQNIEQLTLMKSLDIERSTAADNMQEKIFSLENQIQILTESRDDLAQQLERENESNKSLEKQLAEATLSLEKSIQIVDRKTQIIEKLSDDLHLMLERLSRKDALASLTFVLYDWDKNEWRKVEGRGLGIEVIDKQGKGVVIDTVYNDSPAARRGIKPGDVISQFNGVNVNNVSDLVYQVSQLNPNSVARMWILQEKVIFMFDVVLEEQKE